MGEYMYYLCFLAGLLVGLVGALCVYFIAFNMLVTKLLAVAELEPSNSGSEGVTHNITVTLGGV